MSWPLFQALCRIVGDQDAAALATQAGDPDSWPALLELAQQQQVLPALAQRVAAAPLQGERLPSAVAQTLRTALLNNVRRNMQITAQALKLARSLNAVDIVPLFLKGTAQLLAGERGQYGFRQQLDVDLLLRTGQLDAACDVLLADGYAFCSGENRRTGQPLLTRDKSRAWVQSRAHHHLLPLVKQGYGATVELHRHHLSRRFQSGNPTDLLFASATDTERNQVRFLLPGTGQQIIHMILGRFVHDGYARRYDFPVRSACDYIQLVSGHAGSADLDVGFIEQKCGRYLALFNQLVVDLTAFAGMPGLPAPGNSRPWLKRLETRYRWPVCAGLLDAQGRMRHLAAATLYTPAKLPGYLKRLATSSP